MKKNFVVCCLFVVCRLLNGSTVHRNSTHHLTNCSTPQLLNSSTPQLLNSSTHQLLNSSTHQLLNSSTHHLTISPSHHLTNSPTHQLLTPSSPLSLFHNFFLSLPVTLRPFQLLIRHVENNT